LFSLPCAENRLLSLWKTFLPCSRIFETSFFGILSSMAIDFWILGGWISTFLLCFFSFQSYLPIGSLLRSPRVQDSPFPSNFARLLLVSLNPAFHLLPLSSLGTGLGDGLSWLELRAFFKLCLRSWSSLRSSFRRDFLPFSSCSVERLSILRPLYSPVEPIRYIIGFCAR